MWELLLTLVQRFGLIATLGFLMMRVKIFRNLIHSNISYKDKILLATVFGGIGIFGTYSGVEIYGAIANSRVIGPVIGGLIGGPFVGFGAGIIAGGHRMLLGGFTGFACGIATIIEGTLAGYFAYKYNFRRITWPVAFGVGLVAESIQMGIILLLAKPFEDALILVKLIGVPMTVTNAIGLAIFVTIIQNVRQEQERIGTVYAQKALEIASQTLPYLKKGLTYESSLETARIIYTVTDVDAVAITNCTEILAHIGKCENHHLPGMPIQTKATKQVLEGHSYLAHFKDEIGCNDPNCTLRSGIIVPLKQGETVIGTLKLYKLKENAIGTVDIKLAEGLAHLFSTQLELSELEHRAQLTSKAEIRALQAQINPHFLFNALTAITSSCRADPELARKLTVKLADYFRKNLADADELVSLSVELEHIESFLTIEQVRFADKFRVEYQVDHSLLDVKIPPLTLQPLVENAIKHGVLPSKHGGDVIIAIKQDQEYVAITIRDDGVGIPQDKLSTILKGRNISATGLGIGLSNVHERLICIFGPECGLQISSTLGQGTQIQFRIPLKMEGRA